MTTSPSGDKPAHPHASQPADVSVDVREKGAPRDGQPQLMDRRLFMQLLVLEASEPTDEMAKRVGEDVARRGASVVVYEDVNNPHSVGVLTWSENPSHFVERVRPALLNPSQGRLRVRDAMTMLGRSYSTGYESDLEYWLIRRPIETVQNPDWPWAVWYPLRRGGAFEQLEPREKGSILREHAEIGKAYGAANLAHDVRLACHGLDANDNEFVIGLIGAELHPLSHVVQRMRGTRQTSQYIAQMGPFFVGRAAFRHGA
jgi:chlorite dismutase